MPSSRANTVHQADSLHPLVLVSTLVYSEPTWFGTSSVFLGLKRSVTVIDCIIRRRFGGIAVSSLLLTLTRLYMGVLLSRGPLALWRCLEIVYRRLLASLKQSASDSRRTHGRLVARHAIPVVSAFAKGSSTRPPGGQKVCSSSVISQGRRFLVRLDKPFRRCEHQSISWRRNLVDNAGLSFKRIVRATFHIFVPGFKIRLEPSTLSRFPCDDGELHRTLRIDRITCL